MISMDAFAAWANATAARERALDAWERAMRFNPQVEEDLPTVEVLEVRRDGE